MNGMLSTAAVIVISLIIALLDLIIFNGIHYSSVTLILTLLAFLPYIVSHGNKRAVTKELWVIIITSAFSVSGLMMCSVSEFFRPYTAVVVVSGMFFGSAVGFTCGFFSALVASLLTGTGGWTVYQVTIMGIIGFSAGLFRKKLIRGNAFIIVYTLIFSVIYSCMNILSPIWDSKDGFNFSAYAPILMHSFKWFQIYALSDIIITLIIKNLLFRKIARLKKRFRIFEYGQKR